MKRRLYMRRSVSNAESLPQFSKPVELGRTARVNLVSELFGGSDIAIPVIFNALAVMAVCPVTKGTWKGCP